MNTEMNDKGKSVVDSIKTRLNKNYGVDSLTKGEKRADSERV